MQKNDAFRSQFRIPADLYEKLKAAADDSRRSLNAELVARLDGSFQGGGPMTTGQLIDELMSRFPPGMVEVRVGKIDDDTP